MCYHVFTLITVQEYEINDKEGHRNFIRRYSVISQTNDEYQNHVFCLVTRMQGRIVV